MIAAGVVVDDLDAAKEWFAGTKPVDDAYYDQIRDLCKELPRSSPASKDSGTMKTVSDTHVVEITELGKTYPGAADPALTGVSLTVDRGEIVRAAGPLRLGQVDPPAAHRRAGAAQQRQGRRPR